MPLQHAIAWRQEFTGIRLSGKMRSTKEVRHAPDVRSIRIGRRRAPVPPKGPRMKVSDRSLAAFRELAAAGIMESVPGADGNPEVDIPIHRGWWLGPVAGTSRLGPGAPLEF